MNSLVKKPNLNMLKTDTYLLSGYEQSVQAANGSASVTYNPETNQYEYSVNLGSETQISLYSTEDLLKYHFGDNLDAVKESGDLYILTQSSGYDIIVYKGQLLGYGATEGITNSTLGKECGEMFKNIALEYVGNYLEEEKPLWVNVVFKYSQTGINIIIQNGKTNDEDSYNITEFPTLFVGFDELSPGFFSSVSKPILSDYIDVLLSKAAETYLGNIFSELNNSGKCEIDPDWFVNQLTGYDEYFEKHGETGLEYDGDEINIPFDESAWLAAIQKAVQESIDNGEINPLDLPGLIGLLLGIETVDGGETDDVRSEAGAYAEEDVIPDSDEAESTESEENPTSTDTAPTDETTDDTDVTENQELPKITKEDIIKIVEEAVENTDSVEDIDTRITQIMRIVKEQVIAASTTIYDPLILDLDGDGFNVELKENGTNFDLDTNSFAEKINWTSKDGFITKLNIKSS